MEAKSFTWQETGITFQASLHILHFLLVGYASLLADPLLISNMLNPWASKQISFCFNGLIEVYSSPSQVDSHQTLRVVLAV